MPEVHEEPTENFGKVSIEDYLRPMPRHSVLVVNDNPRVAQACVEQGQRVVLISERYCDASGLTVVRDVDELRRNWQRIGAPEARFLGVHPEHKDELVELCGIAQLNYFVTHRRAAIWSENTIRNLSLLLRPSLLSMADQYRGVPAFIVGAGPSLDKNIQHMAEASTRGIVFAVNGAAKLLPRAPHVHVSIESEDTRTLLGDTRDAIRAFAICCHDEVLRHGTGPLSCVYTTNPSGTVETVTGVRRLDCSVSASTAAANLAVRLGCSPIILVGQDLAYPDGRLYCDGAGGGSMDDDGTMHWGEPQANLPRTHTGVAKTITPVELPQSWGGHGPILTHPDWAVVVRYLIDAGRAWPELGHECWDCTEGGASKGWRELPLLDALAMLNSDNGPSPEGLRAALRQAPPLCSAEELKLWIGAQTDLAQAVLSRAEWLYGLALRLEQEPAGLLPERVDLLLEWAGHPSELARNIAAPATTDALDAFRRSRRLDDDASERAAHVLALRRAAAALMEGAKRTAEALNEQAANLLPRVP